MAINQTKPELDDFFPRVGGALKATRHAVTDTSDQSCTCTRTKVDIPPDAEFRNYETLVHFRFYSLFPRSALYGLATVN